ncbi:MAG: CvpA family protein [Acidobacteriaceae bacterium]
MTPFDWIIVAIIALSAIVAASQGFLREVISLVGLIAGLTLALWNYRLLAAPLSRVTRSQPIANALAFLLIAFGIMIVFGLLGRLIAAVAHTAGLGGLDRLLGAIFGILRGCVLVVIAIIALAAFMPHTTWLRGSRLAPYFLSLADRCSAGAPAELRLKIHQGVAVIEQARPSWIQLNLRPHPSTR